MFHTDNDDWPDYRQPNRNKPNINRQSQRWLRRLNPTYLIAISALLISSWPDGTTTTEYISNMNACQDASEAYLTGITGNQTRSGQKAITSYCRRTNLSPESFGYSPGWGCIQGYNCPTPPINR